MALAGAAEAQRRQGGRPLGPPPRGHPAFLRPRFEPVDREKTCPLLLRVFTKIGGHHNDEDFAGRGKVPKDEVQIYTWMDATLRELTDLRSYLRTFGLHYLHLMALAATLALINKYDGLQECNFPKKGTHFHNGQMAAGVASKVKEVAPAARRKNAKLSFGFVYPDKNGRFKVKEVGMAFSFGNGRLDDSKTLAGLHFQIGDYLDVAIL